MMGNSVVLVAFEERENLGMRYLYAVLAHAGYRVQIIDFRKGKEAILEEVLKEDPFLVGFSVIFDNHIYEFIELLEYLRERGLQCHFTAGGHFASLRPGELFGMAPALDSLVRFEGEHTLLELVDHLYHGRDWKGIRGISYLDQGKLVNTPLRPLEPDLDNFPFPHRSGAIEYALGKKMATLIAGRGCVHNCAFCDISEFYSQPPGQVKRTRNPALVVEEMNDLHRELDCTIFLFQDDDFPVGMEKHAGWISSFCHALKEKGLAGKILWKINCRPDEVDADLFMKMKRHGLFKVYLGIEDGTDSGLKRMNKHLTTSCILKGIHILKELDIVIDYGYMLFQPDTTFESLRKNFDFLDALCGDGHMPVSFLKMLPYLETRIEQELRSRGRLKGKPGLLDYDFNEPSLNAFYQFISENLMVWLDGANGVSNLSRWARNYLAVYRFFNGTNEHAERFSRQLKEYVSEANHFLVETLGALSVKFEGGGFHPGKDREIQSTIGTIAEKHASLTAEVTKIIQKVEIMELAREYMDW